LILGKAIKSEGLEGLKNRKGQGYPCILEVEKEGLLVGQVVESERQQLKNAQGILQAQLGKDFCLMTLKCF